jgi:outer membrane immunogenic protein
MKALVLAAVVAPLVAFTPVEAADMYAPVAKAPPLAAQGCAQFGGAYIGVNVGGAHYRADRNDDDGFFEDNAGHSLTNTGVAAGGQLGYNWQRGCTVFGFEVDGSWSSAKTKFQDDPSSDSIETIDSKLRWFATARTRTGIVVNDLMLYVTGGLAIANVRDVYTDGSDQFSFDKTRLGWTAGLGTEWALSRGWTLKSEALFMQFSQHHDNLDGSSRFTNSDSVWVGRVGLNYAFGAR